MKNSNRQNYEYFYKNDVLSCYETLRPPENLTVSQWADKYRILDEKTSPEPGPWKTSRTPYLEGIMNAFHDVDIEEIIFVKPTQVGGTECLNNILGYIICQNQAPTLIVYPTLDLAEYTSTNRIVPFINHSEEIKKHYLEAESKILERHFDGMYLILSGANSPASLSSRPMQNVLFDEIDKYPSNAGKEADPISLAEERTKNFPAIKKIFKTSTPTLSSRPIWQAWENADCQKKYYMPCPHCGAYQPFIFKQIKWAETAKTPNEAQETAYYECLHCKAMITDSHKFQMLASGEWKSERENGKRKTAFHLNAIYSPWIRFGDIAYKFLSTKDYPDIFMNFINSWLAEPWKNSEVNITSSKVLERQSDYPEGIVPDEMKIITAGVDVQKDCFYYSIRAWGLNMTSWNIAHGSVNSWDEIEAVMNLPYLNNAGTTFQINLCAVDSGARTDEVYDFCAYNQDWAIPVKGSSRSIDSKYRISNIDRISSKAHGLSLYLVDGGQYKDLISGRLQRANGKGSWMVHKNCDKEYAEQITSEEKIKIKKGSEDVFVWKQKSSTAANHYLDCEVYAAMAADLLHVRYFQAEDEPQPQNIPAETQNNEESQDNYSRDSMDIRDFKSNFLRNRER